MNIFLVRHGETDKNKEKNFYGNLDVGLNENGKKQCEHIGDFLKNICFDKVYISSKKRTKQSCEFILNKNKFLKDNNFNLCVDSRINEINFGKFEGKTYEQIKNMYPQHEKKWRQDWKGFTPPQGENVYGFFKRVSSFVDDIKLLNKDNILIVTHGGVMKMIYCYVLNKNLDLYWNFSCDNGDVSLIKFEYNNLFINYITKYNILKKS